MPAIKSDRISRLEGAYDHLATKADIAELKAEMRPQRWLSLAILAIVIAGVAGQFLSVTVCLTESLSIQKRNPDIIERDIRR